MQQEANIKPKQLADLASFPTAGSKEPRFHKPHIASSVFLSPSTWYDFLLHFMDFEKKLQK